VAVQADGKVLLGGNFTTVGGTGRNYIARVAANGTLDAGFNPNANSDVQSVAVQADGKVLLGGNFTTVGGTGRNYIARVAANGTLDAGFNPNANNAVRSVAVQADGQILLGGGFTSVGGTGRNLFARLLNDPATQSLTIPSASRVQWLRGGASPEVEPVTFELSTDGGTIYSALGAGTRISGGWERTGLTLPASGHIRACGRTTNGYFNSGGGLVETVASFSFPPTQAANAAIAAAGLNGPNAELDATPHNDGVQNLLKYAFNMNLSGPDSATMPPGGSRGLPGITAQPNGAASIFRFEFLRRKNSGLIYTPQKSPDISNPALWTNLTDTPTVISIDANWERLIYEEPYNATLIPRCFGRVRVSLP
jgi:uncharacterized delta-60 repeat protein